MAAGRVQDARVGADDYLFGLDDFCKEQLDRRRGTSEPQFAEQRIPPLPTRLLDAYDTDDKEVRLRLLL